MQPTNVFQPAAVRTINVGSLAIPRVLAVAIVAAIGARLAFWLVTDRIWEDALITVTHARNLVAGLGLTHHPGEPVTHGFTSALSVLVPLVGEAVVQGSGIFVLRLVSLAASVLALVFAYRIAGRLKLGRWPTVLVLAYLALDQNQIFYGMAGMETQLAVAILLWSIDTVMAGRIIASGVSFGLALLVRPDFLIWDAVAGLDLLARFRSKALKAAVVAFAVVAPWLIFTTLYYGSPIPQTIIAKSGRFVTPPPAGVDVIGLVGWVVQSIAERVSALTLTFAPFYEDTLTTSAPLPLGLALFVTILMWMLVIKGVIATWRIPGLARRGRVRAAVRAVSGAAPAGRLLRLVRAAAHGGAHPPRRGGHRVPAAAAPVGSRAAIAVVLAIAFAMHLPFSLGLERKLQADIEVGVRQKVGERLAVLVPPGQTLATESAGYYEYYSNVFMLDYPGLVSKRALAIMQSLPPEKRGLLEFLNAAQADWMALRVGEWKGLQKVYPQSAALYEVVEEIDAPAGSFSVDPEGRQRISFAGLVKDASSARLLILRKKADAG